MIVQRAVDAWMSVPPLLFLLFIMSILGPSALNVTIVLGLVAIRESRVLRGSVLSLKEQAFIEAARINAASTARILWKHVLPNVMVPLIILASLRLGQVILIEASLSFLGYGVPAPFPSWGRMLASESRTYMESAPWLAIWPGIFLSLTVCAAVLLAAKHSQEAWLQGMVFQARLTGWLMSNHISFTHDTSLWISTGPLEGTRYSVGLGHTFGLTGSA